MIYDDVSATKQSTIDQQIDVKQNGWTAIVCNLQGKRKIKTVIQRDTMTVWGNTIQRSCAVIIVQIFSLIFLTVWRM